MVWLQHSKFTVLTLLISVHLSLLSFGTWVLLLNMSLYHFNNLAVDELCRMNQFMAEYFTYRSSQRYCM